MNAALNRNLFFVKEHTGVFKAANNYDIHDPNSQEVILHCREENLGFFSKILRFTDYKRMTPFHIEIRTPMGEKLLTVKRGVSIILSNVEVLDANDQLVGKFKQKFFSIGGKFDVLDASETFMCTLQGRWTSWDFKFVKDNVEFAQVSKQWAGLGREMFTSADNYMLQINDKVPADHPLRILILGAVMCIDMVLKE
ncbi:phospholipid scramblase-related protein [Imperialibacter roseus]|uniref:Phospholipid scramblase-related protein n=1 Tax=Imperialibacter roseus TaxID=1324217 RepID=A0ABZ0IQQ1_9BACT|nr:phospholipid scramblase-related protein [Imperialibacter roseus]WOK05917.1 phospholipid scramblase-related protein [Imperialibacter roseus]|tara:strand:- start:34521 stop:35108 length:588 start_codon:yes stop_codon:yes gene_type:complete